MSSTRSSGNNAHTHLAMLQSMREWRHESCAPHNAHKFWGAICLWCSTSAVGRECLANRHKKTRILEETLIFHSDDHSFAKPLTSDLPPLSSSQAVRQPLADWWRPGPRIQVFYLWPGGFLRRQVRIAPPWSTIDWRLFCWGFLSVLHKTLRFGTCVHSFFSCISMGKVVQCCRCGHRCCGGGCTCDCKQ
jgi:hypothetical protein